MQSADIPPANEWLGPLSWAGAPPKGVMEGEIPPSATFTRGLARFMVSVEIQPGMRRETEHNSGALIQLEKSQPVAVHATGPDGRCWTLRSAKKGRKTIWSLLRGDAWPAAEPVSGSLLDEANVAYIYVWSICRCTEAGNTFRS